MNALQTLRESLPIAGAALVGFGTGMVALAARLDPTCRIQKSAACQSVLWAETWVMASVIVGACCIGGALLVEKYQMD